MNSQHILYYEEQQDLAKNIHRYIRDQDLVIVKASSGMHLEKTVEKMIELYSNLNYIKR